MLPKHSLLLSGQMSREDLDAARECLERGLKVIILSSDPSAKALKDEYPDHASCHILQILDYGGSISLRIADGDLDQSLDDFNAISKAVSEFNSEQFVVEHSKDRNIVVTASAGTGKTSVMIDRILFLLDVVEVNPSGITMITFTNEATNQMMSRLQDSILSRFELTKSSRYLRMLEGSSKINISTIDSFSYRLLRAIGQSVGYSSDLSISSDALAVNESLSAILNDAYAPGRRVKDCLGANMHDVRAMVRDFYSDLASIGLFGEDVMTMDWGDASEGDSRNLQNVLRNGVYNLEACMESRRIEGNTVSLGDLVHELTHAMDSYDRIPDIGIEYLFIDEFQDTSDDQIRLVSDIAARTGASLFVVGDPKQSIYRFRGADDSAFDTLAKDLATGGVHDISRYSLVNNYRTDARVLNNMNRRFRSWSQKGLLIDFDPLVPCKGDLGGAVCIKRVNKNSMSKALCHDIRSALKSMGNKKGAPDCRKAVVLVRSNWQLDRIATICDENGIPMVTRRDRPLYKSDAVRDLYSMLSSYIYPASPVHLFGYLESSYSPKSIRIDSSELIESNGNESALLDIIYDSLGSTTWEQYRPRFKREPALSIIRNMIDDVHLLENYASRLKTQGITDRNILEVKVREYRANLDKVMAILHSRFAGDGLDLVHMQRFLSLSIATNKDELEEELDFSDLDVAYCMTVHKAKGLEFDTVIIPFDRRVRSEPRTEMVVSSDRKSVGWMYHDDSTTMCNSLFEEIKKEDVQRTYQEETRILYVAMTRAKRNLIAYTYWHGEGYSWSSLLEG